MEYKIKSISIDTLVKLIDDDKMDLKPSYQRNFIWSSKDQSDLIDTIVRGYPLPSIFIFKKNNGEYEMVDGQQRSRTIYRFMKRKISSSKETNRKYIDDFDKNLIGNYLIPVVEISNLKINESLNEFYALINKKGKTLTKPEVYKSEFFETNFLKLCEDLLEYDNFSSLNLFTESTSKRMNDRAFVEELVAYLLMGTTDKKNAVVNLYDSDISLEDSKKVEKDFKKVIDIAFIFNEIYPLSKTRFKQRNDFYTLFSFINLTKNEELDTLKKQYSSLLLLNRKDKDGYQIIRPSNEDCEPLKEYALHCVSQSNSKNARNSRLKFIQVYLQSVEENEILIEVFNHLSEYLTEDLDVDIIQCGPYKLIQTLD